MRKFTILLALLLFIGMQSVLAQKKISGTVTSSEDGKGIPGATVLVKSTTNGVITDVDGKYTLNVKDGKILVFSFVGMTTKEVVIENQTVINVVLDPESKTLEGVVVTALGISREKKALGYSVQDVKGDELSKARETNVINSLSGKVAGMQISGSSGTMSGSSRVLIRGASSISGNNQPLYVIDGIPIDNSDYNTTNTARGAGGYDYGNMAQDINPDDIESISVLKGANAAALYGSRAANGVILITTKKHSTSAKSKAIGVTYNIGMNWEQVGLLPSYQNKYGGGYDMYLLGYDNDQGHYKISTNGYQSFDLIPTYDIDESWGPAYNTTSGEYLSSGLVYDYNTGDAVAIEVPSEYANSPIYYRKWNSWDEWDTQHYGKSSEWKSPSSDVKDFFKTGFGLTNNIALVGGTDISSARFSYTNLSSDGYMPASRLDRNTINMSANTKIGKKMEVFGTFNYVKNKAKGRPETGYGDNNVVERFNQWGQRSTDMSDLESYINPDGSQRTWNRTSYDIAAAMYSDNPYWTRYKNYQNDDRDRYYGNVGVSYDLLDWLKVTGKVNVDNYTFRSQERVAIGSQATSSYTESVRTVTETNSEFLFLANKDLSKHLHISGTFGGNIMDRKYNRNLSMTSGGLLIPDLYTLSNSASPYLSDDYNSWKRVNSLYGSASLGYMNMAYLDVTLRNDWSSTLPNNKNSYLYPSVALSWVISELNAIKNSQIISFAKIRGGWAQVGNDTDPYNTVLTYTNMLTSDNLPYHFGTNALYTLPNVLKNTDLKPEKTTSIELGADVRLLRNRLSVDFTYYNKKSEDLILDVAISGASGFGRKYVNAGEMSNKGIELMVTGTPIKMENNFQWDISVNYSKNVNEVVKLYPGVDVYLLANGPFNVSVNAMEGERYGTLLGTDYVYDEQGNKVVDADGRYLSSGIKSLGNVLPDWNAGFTNTFKYKGFELSVLIDIQHGGEYFSTTHMWGMYSGILKESAKTNELGNNIRDGIIVNDDGTYNAASGGVLIDGWVAKYDADGNVMFNDANENGIQDPTETVQTEHKNNVRIDGHTWCTDMYDGPAAQNIFDASYIKLREIRIGYTVPKKYTGPIQGLKISAFARNLAIWGTSYKDIDPEVATTSSGNIQGIEGAGLPSLRTYGINLSFNF